MQASTSEPLLLAANQLGYACQQQQQQQQRQRQLSSSQAGKMESGSENMRRKSNRLLARARGSQLIENFSEFLASRNVINRYSRFDKIVNRDEGNNNNNKQQQQHEQENNYVQMVLSAQRHSSAQPPWLFVHHRQPHHQNQSQSQRPIRYINNYAHKHLCSVSSRAGRECGCEIGCLGRPVIQHGSPGGGCCPMNNKKIRVLQLLSALFSRKQRNKRSLMISLLRAPIVLAALFSLILIATLMVLYTMSFHHHHHLGGSISGESVIQRTDELPPPSSISLHHINSRHLQVVNSTAPGAITTNESLQPQNEPISGQSPALGSSRSRSSKTSRGHTEPNTAAQTDDDQVGAYFNRALTIQTECGSFVGSPEGRAIAFKGIPYASPPIGRRRWTRPRPVWLDPELCRLNRTKFAREWAPHCAQLSPVTRRFSGHEDCLYLDIYSPQLDQVKKLPVMVYIHGGFLAFGSSGQGQVNWMKAQPSAKLASELNVVLVAFNYRLQALGFMTLVQLAQNNGPDGSEGNYGLWDQLVALNWIKRNIESFAGDPNNIVLFGPDSASAAPLALASQPEVVVEEEQVAQSATAAASGGKGGVVASQAAPHQEQQQQRGQVDVGQPTLTASSKTTSRLAGAANRDLFRAAWLTNPTVYYEMPYELASQHYQRLFLNQSPCFNSRAEVAGGRGGAELSGGGSIVASNQSDQMLQCLMSLSAEQVVRHYLGKDDPSYRLDDQNSLPIHGIFADQFVTVDRELVQDSYPFLSGGGGSSSSSTKSASNNLNHPQQAANQTSNTRYISNDGSGAAAAANESGGGRNYVYDDNCVGPICVAGKDLLLGSTAQAVEYWPCPRNIDQWTWDDFKRYVATSLNSFITDTYRKASELYNVPTNTTAKRQQGNPKETYLTMVSDIRQTCPVNELANSMQARHHRVHRYIVETAPSLSSWLSQRFLLKTKTKTNTTTTANVMLDSHTTQETDMDNNNNHHKPEYAFHTWDLFAFFGYEFDPEFKPTERDLKFQAQIRQMVKNFVHREPSDNGGNNGWYTLFTKDGARKQVTKYKVDECRMWHRHLGRSYAWVS